MKFKEIMKKMNEANNVITIDFEGTPKKVNLISGGEPGGVAVVKFITDTDIEKYGTNGVEIKEFKKIEDGK